jgi:hypothetical protein
MLRTWVIVAVGVACGSVCAVLPGCGLGAPDRCGKFDSRTPGWGPLPAGYEPCGPDDGTSGVMDTDVLVSIQPNATSDDFSEDLEFDSMLVTFEFPLTELVENHTVVGLGGGAFMGLGGDHTDEAVLASGSVRIGKKAGTSSSSDGSITDADWEMTWDLTYGSATGTGPWYHATGSDVVNITHFATKRSR